MDIHRKKENWLKRYKYYGGKKWERGRIIWNKGGSKGFRAGGVKVWHLQ